MNPNTLDTILLSNVVDLTFTKRDGSTRRMFCTKSYNLLSSFEGENFLRYKAPRNGSQRMAPDQLTVWDIDTQDFRRINCGDVQIESIIPDEEFRKMLVEKYA